MDELTFICHYCNHKFTVGRYWASKVDEILCYNEGCKSKMREENLISTSDDKSKRDVFGYDSDAPKEDAYIRRRR